MKKKRRIVNWEEMIREIKEHNIFELKTGIKFKRRGQFYVTSCPFHQEKTPSLILFGVQWANQGIGWRCFGCGSGGSIIDFYKEHEGVSFYQAVIELARIFKIKIKWENVS